MDGFETAAMIHDHPRFEHTPIIFVTAVHDTEFDRLRAYTVGAVDYVSVPVVPEILRSKVEVFVELQRHRRSLQRLNEQLGEANARLEQYNSELLAERTRHLEMFNRNLAAANEELAASNLKLQSEIAERQRAEDALRRADRQKDEFLAILAHELRNPLAPIRSAVDTMKFVDCDDRAFIVARDIVGRQVTHLTRLVDDLLDVSRISRGAITLNRQPVPIGTLVQRTVETVEPLVAERLHELAIDCADPALEIEVDATRVVQVLSNLIDNAAKYTDCGGRIELRVTANDCAVTFAVRDNGRGIAPEAMANLFTMFSRAHDPASPSGLGIGLALARKLVELHGGGIQANSRGPGSGTEVVVTVPRTACASHPEPVQPAAPARAHANAPAERRCPQRRVLVADDNEDALAMLALLLESEGHEVCTAANGPQALEFAETFQPEIAFLDIGMPSMSGYEVASNIRKHPWGRNMSLVALSGWGGQQDVQKAMESGFDAHIAKPAGLDALSALLVEMPRRAAAPGGAAAAPSANSGASAAVASERAAPPP
jgi:signal transduction histidine kinase/ActR/RegA family two-component response regulator